MAFDMEQNKPLTHDAFRKLKRAKFTSNMRYPNK